MTMRTAAAIAVVSAGVAWAAPDPAPVAPPWSDWVGDFEGPLAWRNCSAPGATRATIAIEAVNGALGIDLTPARGGLRKLSLVEEKGGLVATQGDLKLALTRPKIANTVDLTIELDSGCAITGRLVRATTGVAACDRFRAWARIEWACEKQIRNWLHRPSELAKRVWKPADASGCVAVADKIEENLINAGCAPHPDPLIGARAVECIALTQAAQKLARCGSIPRELSETIANRATALAAAAQSANAGTLSVVEAQCRDARTEVVAISTRFRCTP